MRSQVELIRIDGTSQDIADAARVSYSNQPSKRSVKDLLVYMIRHRHTSPFEMVDLRFKVTCPIFVARQIVRHRTASINEMSGRYSPYEEEAFYEFYTFRGQDAVDKQSSSGFIDGSEPSRIIQETQERCHSAYKALLDDLHVCREQARAVLPLSTMTTFYWKIDLHNFLHFLKLRLEVTDSEIYKFDDSTSYTFHVQKETRDIARMMYDSVCLDLLNNEDRDLYDALKAWENEVLHAVTFSQSEIEELCDLMPEPVRHKVYKILMAQCGKSASYRRQMEWKLRYMKLPRKENINCYATYSNGDGEYRFVTQVEEDLDGETMVYYIDLNAPLTDGKYVPIRTTQEAFRKWYNNK